MKQVVEKRIKEIDKRLDEMRSQYEFDDTWSLEDYSEEEYLTGQRDAFIEVLDLVPIHDEPTIFTAGYNSAIINVDSYIASMFRSKEFKAIQEEELKQAYSIYEEYINGARENSERYPGTIRDLRKRYRDKC